MSALAQVIAWQHLNQCWLLISEALWYSPKSNITAVSRLLSCVMSNFEITITYPKGQWVKAVSTISVCQELKYHGLVMLCKIRVVTSYSLLILNNCFALSQCQAIGKKCNSKMFIENEYCIYESCKKLGHSLKLVDEFIPHVYFCCQWACWWA